MKRSFSFFVLVLFLSAAHAAPFFRDLGRGLAYHRIHQLPGDLPTAESARRQPCVLDLRYVHATGDDATALEAWVRFRATARSPILILANADTDATLLAPFQGPASTASVVIIGAAAPGFAPDIAVRVSRDDERRAYDALDAGTDLAALLDDAPAKPRNDEARLARDFSPDPPPAGASADKPAKPDSPAPVIDAALQRAVQLHRTLLALKRLGE